MRTVREIIINGVPIEKILKQDNPNLRGADLRDTDLWGVNLRGADLQGANLQGAYLWGVNLRYADLRYADLRGAYLWDADLRYADLAGAKGIDCLQNIGSRGDTLYVVKHDTCLMFKTGCFWGTEEEFIFSVNKKHAGTVHQRVYLAAVELLKMSMEVKE